MFKQLDLYKHSLHDQKERTLLLSIVQLVVESEETAALKSQTVEAIASASDGAVAIAPSYQLTLATLRLRRCSRKPTPIAPMPTSVVVFLGSGTCLGV